MHLLSGAVAKLWETSHKQVGFALFCTSSNEGGKHLTGTLFLHRPACGNYSVKSISGLLNVSFTSAHHSHVLCGISSHNIDLETGLCFAYSPRIGFLVIVRLSFRLSFGATAKKQKARVPTYLKKEKILAVYGWLHMTTG